MHVHPKTNIASGFWHNNQRWYPIYRFICHPFNNVHFQQVARFLYTFSLRLNGIRWTGGTTCMTFLSICNLSYLSTFQFPWTHQQFFLKVNTVSFCGNWIHMWDAGKPNSQNVKILCSTYPNKVWPVLLITLNPSLHCTNCTCNVDLKSPSTSIGCVFPCTNIFL